MRSTTATERELADGLALLFERVDQLLGQQNALSSVCGPSTRVRKIASCVGVLHEDLHSPAEDKNAASTSALVAAAGT